MVVDKDMPHGFGYLWFRCMGCNVIMGAHRSELKRNSPAKEWYVHFHCVTCDQDYRLSIAVSRPIKMMRGTKMIRKGGDNVTLEEDRKKIFKQLESVIANSQVWAAKACTIMNNHKDEVTDVEHAAVMVFKEEVDEVAVKVAKALGMLK